LFHTYADLWQKFFCELGVDFITSPETNREIVKRGIALSVDEGCFSSKIYLGHIDWLAGKCDLVFAPRYESTGIREDMCPRIFGMWDVAKRTFPNVKFLHADINVLQRKREQDAFINIGEQLGFDTQKSLAAYQSAIETFKYLCEENIKNQQARLAKDGLKVLIVGHQYNLYDPYIGQGITKYFLDNGVTPVHANFVEVEKQKRVYWKQNAELLSGVQKYKDRVDGIVLVTTFPCGPDSIFNEMIIRQVKDKPILSLMVDELDATAGLQTRLESFVDILTAKRGAK